MRYQTTILRHNETGKYAEIHERRSHTGHHTEVLWVDDINRATPRRWQIEWPREIKREEVGLVQIERVQTQASRELKPQEIEAGGIIIPNPDKQEDNPLFDLLDYVDRLINGCPHVDCSIAGTESGTMGICSCDKKRLIARIKELTEQVSEA